MKTTGRRPALSDAAGDRSALSRNCSACGSAPSTRAEVADLEVVWLVPGLDGAVAPARYCGWCAPTGPVTDHACVDCGDGPLLVGEYADPGADLFVAAAIEEWLHASGWYGSRCGNCRPAAPADRSAHG